MAKKAKSFVIPVSDAPDWPTGVKMRMRDGRLVGVDNSVWKVMTVPMRPVADAKTDKERYNASIPLQQAFRELSLLAKPQMNRRAASKGSYREFHLLEINTPQFFHSTRDHALWKEHNEWYSRTVIDRRVCALAVRLVDTVGNGSFQSALDSVAATFSGEGVPMTDYDRDAKRVTTALTRSGLEPTTEDELRVLEAWWNYGNYADTPFLPHTDHIHCFQSADGMRVAEDAGLADCSKWPEIPGQYSISFAAVQSLDIEASAGTTVVDDDALWVSDLIDRNAMCVSIRGKVEPSKLTRAELRRNRKRFESDIEEKAQQGVMDRAEQTERLQMLKETEKAYATSAAPPSLIDCSAIIGFSGKIEDMTRAGGNSIAQLNAMIGRQPRAMAETWLCSAHRSNPHLQEWPASIVASSGINGLSTVGDSDGMLVGFTEKDRQPAYLSPVAASNRDSLPLGVIAGAVGSGKTQLLLWLAHQAAEMGRPQVVIDPKAGSDHSAAVQASGGQVASLDDLVSADGIFDPLRFSADPQSGLDTAASLMLSINPWGTMVSDYETPLSYALHVGIENGATCIGQALKIAYQLDHSPNHTDVPFDMVNRAFNLASSSPMFSACFGVDPRTQPLRVASGITLIKVGNANLELPSPGSPATSMNQRVGLGIIRMMVFGSSMALTGRQGLIHLDEAWTFLGAGRSEVERLGRLARSQQVLPLLYTQRIKDAVEADLTGYISRGLIMSIEDPDEAKMACELFKLDASEERLSRITAKATKGGAGTDDGAPNWNSFKPLRKGEGGDVIRGSIALYSDLSGERAVPVEVNIPPWFFDRSSTNPLDIARRRERMAAAEAARQNGDQMAA